MNVLLIVLVWIAGIGVARWFAPAAPRLSLHNVWLLALGGGLGIGAASSVYFVTLAFAGPNVAVLATAEGVVLLAAVALGFLIKQRATTLEWAGGPAPPLYLTVFFLVAAAIAATVFISSSINKPHGEWDAWSIWNLRARFLYRAGDSWRDAFSNLIPWSHPDYPLMIPGIVALCWTIAHMESTGPAISTAFLFTFGAAGLLISTIGVLRGKTQAFVAGILIFGTVSFTQIGAYQYADIPLSFYFIATLALLCLQDRFPDHSRFTILAGLTAGFAAWTKNEGWLFIIAVILARAIAVYRYGNRSALLPQFIRMAAGLVAPLAVVIFFKMKFAPANDLLSTPRQQMIHNVADFGRWITVIAGVVINIFKLGSFLVPIVLVLALYWYLVRFKVEDRDRVSIGTMVLSVAFMLAGNCAVYILLSNDVDWQVTTSVDRLLLQIWPPAILAFFLAAAPLQLTPQQAAPEKAKPTKRQLKPTRR